MYPLAELATRLRLENHVGLFVSQSFRVADHASSKTRVLWSASFVELHESGKRQSVDARIEAANAIAQSLRQHWEHAISQVNAVPAPARLAIERAVRSHIGRNIGDVHAKPPTFVGFFNIDGVIEIARIIRINGNNELASQIFTTFEHWLLD